MDNSESKIIPVYHCTLKRTEEYCDYKSDCLFPGCAGMFTMKRNETSGRLERVDRCIGCGQLVYYLDHSVNGEILSAFNAWELLAAELVNGYAVIHNKDRKEWGLVPSNLQPAQCAGKAGEQIVALLSRGCSYQTAMDVLARLMREDEAEDAAKG